MSRRNEAAPVIAAIVREMGFADPLALRRRIRKAYPFGERKGWPYRAWLLEVKRQIGGMHIRKPDPNQLHLFPADESRPDFR